jgi:hypothetical protein
MKNPFKKRTILITLALLSLFTANAQSKGCDRLDNLESWMKDSLSLDENQHTRIASINDSACIDIKAIKSNSTGDKEADKMAIKNRLKLVQASYKSVLTPKQLELLKAHRKQHAQAHKKAGHNKEQRALRLTNEMKSQLLLNDLQYTQVHELNSRFFTEKSIALAIADSATRKTQLKALKKAYNGEMLTILTDEQDKLFQKMLEERKKNASPRKHGKH